MQNAPKPSPSPDNLSSFVTSRPVAVTMVFAAAVVFGAFSLNNLPVTLMPELAYPTLTVRTEYPGAAPEEVENDISRPVEEALGVVSGLNKISSISRAGVSDVVLEFVWGTEMSKATQDTLEKLDGVLLPEDAERPLLLHFDPALDPVLELSFSGAGEAFDDESGLRALRRIAELQIRRVLEPVKGVAAVRIRGGLEEEIHVLLDEDQMHRTDLSIDQVMQRLSQENINVAGGTIKEGRAEYMVRTLNEFANLDQMRQTIIVKREGGQVVRLGDIARIERAHKDREIITRTSGRESVQIDIYKEADANIVALAERIRAVLGPPPGTASEAETETNKGPAEKGAREAKGLATLLYENESALLEITADRSIFIQSSINEVRDTAFYGGILAVIVLFLFLRNFKSTVIIALSIPMSLVITFAPLNTFGVSLNIMSLGGLALGIGMLVDSSIVVLESIFRCREEGDSVMQAAIRGTAEVRGAVFASILTSIAVFFPMVFVEGIAGQAFGDLGMAVVVSLLASLLVALFFIPMLASREGVQTQPLGAKKRLLEFESPGQFAADWRAAKPLGRCFGILFWVPRLLLGLIFELIGKLLLLILGSLALLIGKIIVPLLVKGGRLLTFLPLKLMDLLLGLTQKVYDRMVRWALNNKLIIFLATAICLFFTLEIALKLPSELLPEVHQGEFTLELSLPVGTPLEKNAQIMTPVEQAILENLDDIQTLLVTYGYDVTNTKRSDEGEHSAKFKVILRPSDKPAQLEEQVIASMRRHLADIPDLDLRLVRPVLFSAATPIEVEIHGYDLKQLKSKALEAQGLLAGLPALSDVESALKSGAPEIQIRYDRERMMRYGLNISQVAEMVRDKIKGNEATRFNMKDRRVPIVVRLEGGREKTMEEIAQIRINPGQEKIIPLHAVSELYLDEGPSEIRRIDGRRVALISANLAGRSLSAAAEDIRRTLNNRIDWPADMNFFITGQNEEWERSQGSLYLALFLSIFLVYVIMAAQFESLLYPFVIMFSIPLAFFGTVLALQQLNISLSVVVFLGMIMLAGIVVNNAIVLVDYANTLKTRGLDNFDAIVQAGSVRLRPILMTTATTVLGLLPMAIGWGDGAEIRKPMAIAVISGLITSTLLTLIVIPALMYALDQIKLKLYKH